MKSDNTSIVLEIRGVSKLLFPDDTKKTKKSVISMMNDEKIEIETSELLLRNNMKISRSIDEMVEQLKSLPLFEKKDTELIRKLVVKTLTEQLSKDIYNNWQNRTVWLKLIINEHKKEDIIYKNQR